MKMKVPALKEEHFMNNRHYAEARDRFIPQAAGFADKQVGPAFNLKRFKTRLDWIRAWK